MSDAGVFVGVPIYGAVPGETVGSLMGLCGQRKFRMQMRTRLHDSLVTRSRNSLTADFLLSDCERLLFIDSDLIFSMEQVERIISHPEDVVGGLYPIKNYDPEIKWCANGYAEQSVVDERGLSRVRYVGTGFMCIKRHVFQRMISAGLAHHYVTDSEPKRSEWDFWSVGVHRSSDEGRPRYLSEDWMFCQRWLDLGGTVWVDTQVKVKHVGEGVWPLPHQVDTMIVEPPKDVRAQ